MKESGKVRTFLYYIYNKSSQCGGEEGNVKAAKVLAAAPKGIVSKSLFGKKNDLIFITLSAENKSVCYKIYIIFCEVGLIGFPISLLCEKDERQWCIFK